jgi:GT2 family glycosyltransferase
MIEAALHVLVWNDLRDLPELIRSLRALTYKNVQVRILDNGSSDGSLEYLKEFASDWLAISHTKNVGFAAGHNQLMRLAFRRWANEDLSSKVILAINADMILKPDFVERLLEPFQDPHVGATQPKIYRAFRGEDEHASPNLSRVLDTTGLVLGGGWRMEDRGAGMEDMGVFDEKVDLIGPAGALPCYRASALQDVAENDAFFDEAFFAYREDCDLALRLKKKGWKTVFCPQAHVWHFRGMYGAQKRNLFARWRDRRSQARHSAAYSTRNQLFFLVKHFPFSAWASLPRVLFHEVGRIVYGFCCEPLTRRVLLRSLTIFPQMFTKRKEIFRTSRLSWDELRLYVKD